MNYPIEIKLIESPSDTKILVSDSAISPNPIIGKRWLLATWILEELVYLQTTLITISRELVMWLDAGESTSQDWEDIVPLPYNPKEENGNTIICCTISSVKVSVAIVEGDIGVRFWVLVTQSKVQLVVVAW